MKRRELLLAAVSMAVAVVACLGVAEIALRFLPVASGLRTLAVTPEQPIFRLTPNRDFVYSRDWDFDMANRGHVNNAGFVNDQDYVTDGKTPLLALIGDSYVEALMVPFAETIQGRLARKLDPKFRVYSFAASGAPLSQYLIWARHAVRDYRATALVINVVGNDFDESHVDYKSGDGFWLYAPDGKGELHLALQEYRPNWIRQVVPHSAVGRYAFFNLRIHQANIDLGPLRQLLPSPAPKGPASPSPSPGQEQPAYAGNTQADADAARVNASLAAMDAFFRDLPVYTGLTSDRILFLLDGFRYPDAAASSAGTYYDLMRRAFRQKAEAKRYETVDLDPAFFAHYRQHRQRFEWPRDGHWNAIGHGLAAEAVLKSQLLARLTGQ